MLLQNAWKRRQHERCLVQHLSSLTRNSHLAFRRFYSLNISDYAAATRFSIHSWPGPSVNECLHRRQLFHMHPKCWHPQKAHYKSPQADLPLDRHPQTFRTRARQHKRELPAQTNSRTEPGLHLLRSPCRLSPNDAPLGLLVPRGQYLAAPLRHHDQPLPTRVPAQQFPRWRSDSSLVPLSRLLQLYQLGLCDHERCRTRRRSSTGRCPVGYALVDMDQGWAMEKEIDGAHRPLR